MVENLPIAGRMIHVRLAEGAHRGDCRPAIVLGPIVKRVKVTEPTGAPVVEKRTERGLPVWIEEQKHVAIQLLKHPEDGGQVASIQALGEHSTDPAALGSWHYCPECADDEPAGPEPEPVDTGSEKTTK